MNRFFTFIAACACLWAGVDARELAGRVTDKFGAPLPGVSIVTNVTGVGTQTDATGSFRLILPDSSAPSSGDKITRVTFSSVGYQSVQYRIGEIPTVVALSQAFLRGQDIVVSGDRAIKGVTPIAFEDFTRDDIKRDYQVGEFPILLESTPNLYAHSDGGGRLGDSYMSIRGFDDKRISTYINGVPLNDPEDQTTYFVDLPDFASSVTDIQIQRGVGNSLYGDASFGGSVNIVTNAFARPRLIKLIGGWGAYTADNKRAGETAKQSLEYTSGLIDGRWNFTGRFSRQRSGGYRDNSWYQGWAYYFSMARLDPRSMTEIHVYGGPERNHLAYDAATLNDIALNRRTNDLTYNNEVDDFNQPHYQIHNVYKLTDRATLSNTLYYIQGRGYYEQLKPQELYRLYGLDSTGYASGDSVGDLVRQQWVDKNQWGWNPRLEIEHARGKHTFGGSFYYFDSDHWGQVISAQHLTGPIDPTSRYYQYYGKKWVGSFYAQEEYRLTDKLSLQGTAQLRYQRYKFTQDRMGAFHGYAYNLHWTFFSPRLGFNYRFDDHTSAFVNVAISSRTPTDADIYDGGDPEAFPLLAVKSWVVNSPGDTTFAFGDPQLRSERVINYELGARHREGRYTLGANLFWMDFRDEILPYGGINKNTGLSYRINADRSVHSGIELSGDLAATDQIKLSLNWAVNYNRVRKYTQSFLYVADSLYQFDFKGRTIPGFPDNLGNVMFDYNGDHVRLTAHVRFVGRQYVELLNIDSLAIKPYTTTTVTASYALGNLAGLGKVRLSATVDNLFNKKYYSSGYGDNWAERTSATTIDLHGDGWYYVAAERSFYTQLELEFF
jgi:iron complex outermembrane recepter protein